MGSVVKRVTGVFQAPQTAQYNAAGNVALDKRPFDISKEIKPTKDAYATQKENALINQSEYNQAGNGLADILGKAARGEGPSLAGAQLKAAQERNLAQQLGALSAARGGNAAANQRALAQTLSATGRQTAQDAAIAGLQERNAAQDRFLNAQNIANQQARQDILQQGDLDLAQKKSEQQFELARANQASAVAQANLASAGDFRKALLSGTTGALSAAIPALVGSDKKLKKDIKDGSKEIEKFLEAISAKSYKYKDSKFDNSGSGQKYGIMAQDLEKSKVGKTLVKNTPEGKMVSIPEGFGAVLASQAELHKRLKALEKKKK